MISANKWLNNLQIPKINVYEHIYVWNQYSTEQEYISYQVTRRQNYSNQK